MEGNTSFINKLNRKGERWLPRGTPEITFIGTSPTNGNFS